MDDAVSSLATLDEVLSVVSEDEDQVVARVAMHDVAAFADGEPVRSGTPVDEISAGVSRVGWSTRVAAPRGAGWSG